MTVATTILKPGGYQRLKQMAEITDGIGLGDFSGIDVPALELVSEAAVTDRHHVKSAKPLLLRKSDKKVPLIDCYTAPCEDACPIHQEITTYVKLAGEGKYEEALKVILNRMRCRLLRELFVHTAARAIVQGDFMRRRYRLGIRSLYVPRRLLKRCLAK